MVCNYFVKVTTKDPVLQAWVAMSDNLPIPRQRFLDQCSEPVFQLDRKARILHVNQAWLELTGLDLTQVRGQVCQRRLSVRAGSLEALWNAHAPPVETLSGSPRQVRRFLSFPKPQDWDIAFFPFMNGSELLGILGKITVVAIERSGESAPLPNTLLALRERIRQHARLDRLIATAPSMQRVLGQMRLAATTNCPVWVVGEPGTGKRWLARVIHRESERTNASFVVVDCACWPVEVLQKRLFGSAGLLLSGHVGTIYLRELPALPRELQSALADWLVQAGEESQRPRLIVGATQLPDAAVRNGQMLDALSYLFGVLTIAVPPLRERKEDISLLADHFSQRVSHTLQIGKKTLSAEVVDLLREANWPENVRELQRIIGDVCETTDADTVSAEQLPWYLRTTSVPETKPLDLDNILQQVERRLIMLAMEQTNNNKSKAAEMLSVWRARLVKRCKEMGIDPAQSETKQ